MKLVNEIWINLLKGLTSHGHTVTTRGADCLELLCQTTVVPMTNPVITVATRKLGYKFMAAEAAWILSGDNRVITIAPYSSRIREFSDDGVRFFGAYGPPVRDQLGHVVRALRGDNMSRQAVLTIWRQNPPQTKDVPCTVALQWMIRDGQLHCFASMRSSDTWLGWPYDVVNFSVISRAIQLELLNEQPPALQLGRLYLTAASQHLYARDKVRALECCASFGEREAPFSPTGNTAESTDALISYLWEQANA